MVLIEALAGLVLATSAVVSTPPQRLEAAPSVAQVGRPVVLTALSGEGTALVGVAIRAVGPDGAALDLGTTDDAGHVRFEPPEPGEYVFSTEVAGARVLLTFVARPESPRLWYALACVPLGLVLVYANARRLGRRAQA